MLKANDKTEFTAEFYGNAETVGRVDGSTVFVPRLIVGEKAVVKINYAKNGVAYGDAVELLEKSESRVAPVCPVFGKCGGCSLMHMSYKEQLVFKREKVKRNLTKIGGVTREVLPCEPSNEELYYRNKLSLPVRGKKGAVKIGMYQKNSHNLVNCENCFLAGEWAKKLISIFFDYLNSNNVVPYDERTFTGDVRHLAARYVDGQLLVTVVSNGEFKGDLTPLADSLKKEFPVFGLFVNENTQKNNVILGKITKHICGIKYVESEHLGVIFRIRPDSFFQVNNGVKNKIYEKVKELLDLSETEILVDCFSGVGVLTNVLASEKYLTYAVEIEKSAVLDAEEMRILNGTNIVNVCGDANVELTKLAEKHKDRKMSIVVDPPRKGLGEKICKTVCETCFDEVVYISCDSATLARDLKILCGNYVVTYVQPYDMFPQTEQVETLVHLVRKTDC